MRAGELPVTSRMVGRRFGSLTILGVAEPRRYPGGQAQPYVLARCDCGTTVEIQAWHVREGTSSCVRCGWRRSAVHSRCRGSVLLPNGWTIAEIALGHGLELNTVYRRWLRGWPIGELGAPKGSRYGLGGSCDRDERRGTVLGKRAP